jgi:hypothetical protein
MQRKHHLLILLRLSMLTLAGCSQLHAGKNASTRGTASPTDIHVPTRASNEAQTGKPWQQLDLRYAQVLAVIYELLDSSQVRFDVTMIHDDDGEAPQYADWWQVEDLSGNVLGKRVLTHAHGTQPFTRSATIELPDGVNKLIIRGHDMRHGFSGQVIQLNLEMGEQIILTDYP